MPTTSPIDTSTSIPADDAADDQAAPRPAVGSGAEQQLRAALRAQPCGTSAELALAAGIGRSTAAKILCRWAANGTATKTAATVAGGRGRPSEVWSLTVPTTSGPARPSTDTDPTADLTAAPPAADADAGDDRDGGENVDVTDDLDATARTEPADVPAAAPVPTTPDLVGGDGDGPDGDSDRSRAAGASDEATAGRAALRRRVPETATRLKPGSLRGMVEDFLREHPDRSHGPSQIGKALGRSSGAVANALLTLKLAGTVVCAQDKPLRYTLAPDRQDHPTPTA